MIKGIHTIVSRVDTPNQKRIFGLSPGVVISLVKHSNKRGSHKTSVGRSVMSERGPPTPILEVTSTLVPNYAMSAFGH